ncbi:glycosyl hydrolase family 65, N-terminal domain-containing protein, partial [Schizophyllum fasciatum]
MWTQRAFLLATQLLAATQATRGAPNGFPQSGNGLWYNAPGVYWGRDFLPVGNGYLAAMTPGGTTVETTQLNIESLWSGGPFQNSSYNGGNKLPSDRHATQEAMDRIRRDIFSNETGTVGSDGAYAGAGYLFTTIDASGKVSDYARWLDLDQAVARTTWTQGGVDYN